MRNDKRDDLSIEVLNRLDEEIVEKNLNRRFELLQKLKEKTKRILTRKQKAWIFGGGGAAAAVLLAFLGIFLFSIFAKQVPVYTGMTVSRAPQTVASGYDWDQHVYLDASGDLVTTESTTALTEAVEEAVKDSLQVEGAAEKMYYANRGEDIYITVHIDNPDSYEILSFTLNGQKYTSYMFEQGSDLENLILKVNVGQDEGVVEYTIDAIKYVDGTEIKDVKMDGERTVRVGIYTEDQPTAAIGKMHVGLDYLKLNVTVEDKKLLIERSLGTAAVVLYDGVGLPKFEIVPVGETTEVTIEGLTRNTEYELAVVFAYDDLSGSGFAFHTPLKQTVRTQNYLSFEEVSTTQTAVSFAVEWFEEFENKEIVALALFRNGEKVKDLPPTALAADGLLCNNVYTLVATIQADGEYETVEVSFKTKAKTAPTVFVTESAKTQTSLDFAINVTDPDAIASITKIELLDKNGAVVKTAENLLVRSFGGLAEYTKYSIRVTYAYDLNDGDGVHTKTSVLDTFTAPHYALAGVECLNTTAIKIGDRIVLKIQMDMTSGLVVKKATVNGNQYGVSTVGTSYIAINIPVTETLGGGSTQLVIEKLMIEGCYRSEAYYAEPAANHTVNVFINGNLDITGVKIVDSNGNETTRVNCNDGLRLLIDLNNPTGYTVTQVEVMRSLNSIPTSSMNVTHVSAEQILVVLECSQSNCGFDQWYLSKLTFGNATTGSMTKSFEPLPTSEFTAYDPDTVVYITEPEQLFDLDLESGDLYYLLMNDLDLSGFDVDNFGRLEGIFDGNGYSIKNYTVNRVVANGDHCFGLFEYGCGLVRDLNLEDVSVTVVNMGDATVSFYGIAGNSGGGDTLSCYDCTLSGEITIAAPCNVVRIFAYNPADSYNSCVNCINYADISVGSILNGEDVLFADFGVSGCKNYGELYVGSNKVTIPYVEDCTGS